MTSPNQYGQQPPPPKAPKTRSGAGSRLLVVGVAAVAVLLALVAVGISWRANGKATDALDRLAALSTAAPVQPVANRSTPPSAPTEEPTSSAPAPLASGSDPQLSKETQFGVKYVNETLRMPAGRCGTEIYVDVDEPRVRLDNALAELAFTNACDRQTPSITLSAGVRGA